MELDLFADDASEAQTIGQTQQSLIDTQQKLGSMLDAMPIGLLFHTEQGVLFANQEACRLLKADKPSLSGQHFLDHIRETELEVTSKLLKDAFEARDDSLVAESVIRCSDGVERLTKVIAGRLPWEGTPVIQILFQDITDQKRTEQSLRKLSITDELTGAYNRRHVFYEAALYISQDTPPSMSAILVDIDHFKLVNDTYGHAVGDLALKELSRLAHDFVPKIPGCDSAIFGRIGGEEFLILLPGLAEEAATREAEAFRQAIAQLEVPSETGELIPITISSGVAEYRSSDKSFDVQLSRADEALYRAKSEGRNRVCVAN